VNCELDVTVVGGESFRLNEGCQQLANRLMLSHRPEFYRRKNPAVSLASLPEEN